jgi:hypothetical protein
VSGGDVVRTRGGEALTVVGASARGARESEAAVRERPGWLALVGQKRGGGPLGAKKSFSNFFFQIIFKYQFSNPLLSKKITFSENGPKIKSCLEFNPLQLCFRDQLKILHRF